MAWRVTRAAARRHVPRLRSVMRRIQGDENIAKRYKTRLKNKKHVLSQLRTLALQSFHPRKPCTSDRCLYAAFLKLAPKNSD